MQSKTSFRDLDDLDGGYAAGNHCHTYVVAGVVVVSALYGGVTANNAAKKQAGQSRVAGMAAQSEGAMDQAMRNLEADDVRAEAGREADQIKRQAAQMRGQIVVAQSGSGVMIGEGSAQAAVEQLDTLSSADALAALYSSVNKSASIRASGRFAAEAGKQTNMAMGLRAGSQTAAGSAAMIGGVLNAAGGLAGGYAKTQTPTKK